MKKWLVALFILVMSLVLCYYLLLPKTLAINGAIKIKANEYGLARSIMDEMSWAKWWPGRKDSNSANFYFRDHQYTIIDKRVNSLIITIDQEKSHDTSVLNILAVGGDSIIIAWDATLSASSNPFPRLQNYTRWKGLRNDISDLLDEMKKFYIKTENIYGIPITQQKVVDSTLLQNSAVSKGYPTTDFIYGLIDEMQRYCISQSAKQTGAPMLNITTEDSSNYFVKVAIPVDKKLKSSGNMVYRWMLGGGNILEAEIKGGPASVANGFKRMEDYVNDYRRVVPAIPFQSLVTDRRMEKDSNKWITKIFYPVM